MKKIVAILICFLMLFSFAACGETEDPNVTKIKISFFKAGFGDEWIKAIAAQYESENEGIKIVIEGDEQMDDLVKTRFESGDKSRISDIVSVTNMTYFNNFVRDGYLEDLTDLYKVEIENGDTLNDLVDDNFVEFAKVQGKPYGIPWEGAVTGFAYNTKMFAQHGWTVPKTMDEFFELCTKIKEKNIAPLVYNGGRAEGYFGNQFLSWFVQYEGKESADEFFAMEDASVFEKEGRKLAYEQVAKMVSDKNIRLTGSNGFDHLAAQREFIKGNAAMISTGSWLQTEMSSFLKGYPNFEMAMFPVPSILADNEGNPIDKNGNPAITVNTGNGDLLCIPKDAPQKELAKDFLLYLQRQSSLKLYVEKTGGNPRPYRIDNTDWSNLSTFGKSLIEIWQSSNNVFPYSPAPAFLSGKIGFNMAKSGNFCSYLQAATSSSDALARAQELYESDITLAEQKFAN